MSLSVIVLSTCLGSVFEEGQGGPRLVLGGFTIAIVFPRTVSDASIPFGTYIKFN